MLRQLTGEEKSALLLRHLAPEVAEAVLSQLPTDHGRRLRLRMKKLADSPDMDQALKDILTEIQDILGEDKKTTPVVNKPAREEKNWDELDNLSPIVPFSRPSSREKPVEAPEKRVAPGPAETGGGTSAAPPSGPRILNYPSPAPSSPAPTSPAPAPPPEPARKPEPEKAAPGPGEPEDPLAALASLPVERLGRTLEGENPRTVSLILNYLDTERAGEVFKTLGAELRQEVSLQFTNQVVPSMEVLRQIAQAVLIKSRTLKEKPAVSEGTARFRKMADLLRILDKPERLAVLNSLEQKDPTAAGEVKNFLYRLEDVLRLDDRSVQKLLTDLDTKGLAIALKGVEEAIKEKFLHNLSKRAQETLLEEMDLAQRVQKEDIVNAQKEILAVMQRLDAAGDISLSP